jgi:carbonic anhydrase
MKTRYALVLSISLLGLIGFAAEEHSAPKVGAEEALTRLKTGNRRFVSVAASTGKPTAARRAETAQEQHPFALIVGCADSRTPPELIFDQNLGDLFVVRTAGNLVDEYALGSIEYAVDHLGVRLIVVLGHERCGAVGAALAANSAPGHINALVRDIQPAVQAAKSRTGDVLANTVKENATQVAGKIRKEANFGKVSSEIRVTTGYYDLDTGDIEWAKE